MDKIKICAYKPCSKPLIRAPHCDDNNWKRKKYCNKFCCSAAGYERNKHKQSEWGKIRRANEKNWQPTVKADHPLLKIRFA